jgi:hypothetical protein
MKAPPNRDIAPAPETLKGRRAACPTTPRHGQRPDAPARRTTRKLRLSSPERAEPTPLLNHETSDHLLSLVEDKATMSRPRSAIKTCIEFF